MKRGVLRATALGLLVGVAGRAEAGPVGFGFEARAATSSQMFHPGSLTTSSQAVSGLTATVTRPGSAFDFVDTSSFLGVSFPASWGGRCLDPFTASASNTPFVVNFSAAARGVSVEYGDFGEDPDAFTLRAFSGADGTGTLLATATGTLGIGSLPTFDTASVSAGGILSIVMIGGSADYPNSVYYDNLTVTFADAAPVPEPGTLALALAAALVGLGARHLGRR